MVITIAVERTTENDMPLGFQAAQMASLIATRFGLETVAVAEKPDRFEVVLESE